MLRAYLRQGAQRPSTVIIYLGSGLENHAMHKSKLTSSFQNSEKPHTINRLFIGSSAFRTFSFPVQNIYFYFWGVSFCFFK